MPVTATHDLLTDDTETIESSAPQKKGVVGSTVAVIRKRKWLIAACACAVLAAAAAKSDFLSNMSHEIARA